jgi:hypothetical protein
VALPPSFELCNPIPFACGVCSPPEKPGSAGRRRVHAILDRLALAGIVDLQQSGRAGIATLRENNPLTRVIRRLFQEERVLFDPIVTTVRDAAGEAIPDVRAVWETAGPSVHAGSSITINLVGALGW